jgi:hypothetical protein
MTVSYSQQSLLEIAAGLKVSKAANVSPLVTGGVNLFTISGGRVLLVALYGQVTTIIQAQATTVKFTSTPTTGTALDLSTAGTDLTGKEAGAHLTLASSSASGLIQDESAGTDVVVAVAGYVNLPVQRTLIPPGIISVTYGAASTGAIEYDLIYVPYDAAAVVTAD